jgi:hypothetical protein
LESNVSRLHDALKNGGLIGECDHPSDSIIHFANCSHKINKLWWDGNVLMGEGTIVATPMGKLLMTLINEGVRIGISSRGVGTGKVNEEGVLVIGESYKLITFDAVADPSTSAAFQERIKESMEIADKNEIGGIYSSNGQGVMESNNSSGQELFASFISELIKDKTNKIKERL